jgi:S-adenosyl-methyltransferase MraW
MMSKEDIMFHHISVLLNETIDGLNIKEDGIYVDCTLGGGGHSAQILKRLTTGHLYCFDQDQIAIKAADERLKQIGNQYTIIYSNFKDLKAELHELGIHKVDGIVFDLGVSSPQFDDGERGFSYNYDAKLDMRMDRNQSLNAYDIVNHYSYNDLVKIFYKYGDEKFSKSIARMIEKKREEKSIETTFELVEIIKSAIPAKARRKGGHPAKRCFQALRIAVNDELNVFDYALKDALDMLEVNGRIAVITFHSLEDKICKYTFKEVSKQPEFPLEIPYVPDELKAKFKMVTKKPIVASQEEMNENHRSHSAKLRIIERIYKDEKE